MPRKIHRSKTKSRPAVGRISCLAEEDKSPIHAEPLQKSIRGRTSGYRKSEAVQ